MIVSEAASAPLLSLKGSARALALAWVKVGCRAKRDVAESGTATWRESSRSAAATALSPLTGIVYAERPTTTIE
ncbi:MAG: hypothetical protein EOQ75_03820 [Mesorhizobium sp.]|nr:MAG: hypothetical protein EOQ75_03820 [Mesorhizobium sp.]